MKPEAPPSRIRSLSIPSGVINNLFAMYGIYCASYLLALVTVPYLSRTLGPAMWGMVAAVQSFGGCLLVGVEFGFTLSGTRAAARAVEDRQSLKEVVSSVLGAKILLALVGCGIALIVEQFLPLFSENPAAFWWGVLWGVLQGANLMWFFQGVERMRLAASLDFAIRLAAVAAIFGFVKRPADAWQALAFQALASLASLIVSIAIASKLAGFHIPRWDDMMLALRSSVRTFIPRNASVLYTVGNTFLLGFFARPEIVGFYAGADRICRAVFGLLAPASEAVYPRISHVAAQSRIRALRLARLSAVIVIAIGALMGIAVYLFAPLLVRVLLGPGYNAAILPLRVLSLLPPLVAFRNVLAIHWMLPLDMESELNAVVLICGACNVVLAVIVAPHYGGVGMAWVVVVSQLLASLGTWLVLRWKRLDPFGSDAPKEAAAAECAAAAYAARSVTE